MAISPSRLLAAASMACAARCSILRLPFVFPFRTTNKAEGVDPAFPHPRLVTPRPTCRCKCMRPPCIDPSGRHEPPSLLPMRCDCQLCRARSARSALAQGEAMRAGPVSREWAVSPNCPSQPDLAVCAAQALLLRLALPCFAAASGGGFTSFSLRRSSWSWSRTPETDQLDIRTCRRRRTRGRETLRQHSTTW